MTPCHICLLAPAVDALGLCETCSEIQKHCDVCGATVKAGCECRGDKMRDDLLTERA